MRHQLTFVTSAILLALACASPTSPSAATSTSATTATPSGSSGAPAWYAKFGSAVTVSVEGSTVVLRSTGVPDHASPYWGTGHTLYEAPHAGMQVNPNRITTQSIVLRVPMSPSRATASDTPMGVMGIAVNGVALFNQYAAGRSPLTNEILSFDRFNGHPQQQGTYHYHLEPLWLTARDGMSALIGVLLDGYPVYGPRESDGALPSGLDTCNGHTHATADFASGTYHYHVTTTVPYISGCLAGAPGSLG
ncbi:MAG: YHYH protein [Acidobacteria bacterium]|nr:YHYH protein [Acidobacteriota bacterium]